VVFCAYPPREDILYIAYDGIEMSFLGICGFEAPYYDRFGYPRFWSTIAN
jgi:hypothetical protein